MTIKIGEFLVQKGVLTPQQVMQILDHGRKMNLRFGEAAMDLNLLDQDTMVGIFGRNYRVDYFHLDAAYYPASTKDLFSIDLILKYGALPLGFKTQSGLFKAKKKLNLGLLDPGRKDAVEALEAAAQAKDPSFTSSRVFLVLAEKFLGILSTHYALTDRDIRARNPEAVDHTLALFVER